MDETEVGYCPICGAKDFACRDQALKEHGMSIRKERYDMGVIANRRLWATSDRSEIVEDGDPRAHWLVSGGPNTPIDDLTVAKYGKEVFTQSPKVEAKAPDDAPRKKAPSGPARKKAE